MILNIDFRKRLVHSYLNEIDLQDDIERLLKEARCPYSREHRFSKRDIVDFLVADIAVEVKIDGSVTEITRQLHRYAQHECVRALVLITTRARHHSVPTVLRNKRIEVVYLVGTAL